jgi:hypothetical protein
MEITVPLLHYDRQDMTVIITVIIGTLKGQEDVKKMICLSFRDFIFDPECLPTPQRSLIGHPRAIFLRRVRCKF